MHDAHVIADIFTSLGTGDINGGKQVCGTSLVFLSEQLKVVLEQIEEGMRL